MCWLTSADGLGATEKAAQAKEQRQGPGASISEGKEKRRDIANDTSPYSSGNIKM